MVMRLKKTGSQKIDTAAEKRTENIKQNQAYYMPVRSFFFPVQRMEDPTKNLQTHITTFRQSDIIQRQYKKSESGDAGVYFDLADHSRPVVKIGGYSEMSPLLDRLAGHFGLGSPNSHFVFREDAEWGLVETALREAGENIPETLEKALIMDFVEGKDLWEDNIYGKDLSMLAGTEKEDLKRALSGMGKLLVMDLLTRNNDRFPLSIEEIKNENEIGEEDGFWKPWGGNEENIRVGEHGMISAIDSEFTDADNEEEYARVVGEYLTDPARKRDLAIQALGIMDYIDEDEERRPPKEEDIAVFIQGIDEGIERLLSLDITRL